MVARYIILDRDGVINEDSDAYIKSPEEWRPIPGSLEAIARLHRCGWKVVIITNQSGLARGYFDAATLDRIHAKLREQVAERGGRIEAIYYCPHGPDDHCDCRKPKPGLLQRLAREKNIDLRDIPAVGDALRDIQAARAVGASPILVRTGKGANTLAANPDLNLAVYDNLYEAVRSLTSPS